MRVLLTNNTLGDRAGTEVYVLEVALRLRELGHEPAAYSTHCGEVADTLHHAGIPVVDNAAKLPFKPDIIHGQHHLETMTVLLAHPGVPAMYFCHGALPWEETPPVFPRIHRYVAVDEACRARLESDPRIARDSIRRVLNFADLRRYQPRPPLPERPRRALVFSNYANENNHLAAIRTACAHTGIELDVRGLGVGITTNKPEELLPRYDLVFAKGRAALEAMAVGCAVIVCDARGCGPLVTPANFAELRPWNFGLFTMREETTPERLTAEIARYHPGEATAVSRMARTEAGLEPAVDAIIKLYQEAITEQQRSPADTAAESRAAADYLRWLSPTLKQVPRPTLPWTRRRLRERLARKADSFSRWLRND